MDTAQFKHPALQSIGGTVVAYALIIFVMTALLFGVPYLLFLLL
ncbi:uncharacterized protein NP_1674A [Natronomonas pharaonis DSM 2160]|uniref:Uncharacterized protein n=1 Tax=Natronomonas pharaonis (strain ATCC 35678 / DSM 2160 / CIP 103997 / JCM 8858 / NBRC 14720 / NCIMB 2260 / Gabara) TaxID=348780 RepID=A0A1U7EV82_NATPD|nr:hypothetical protein [Natronomonas pharaonis]CAI48928.1 uncharacterized protein NP_1674A [Natronomonas pharaonis DSM 2160]